MVPEDLHFLDTPTQAVATATQHVEVTLLKILLTELRKPLWAFQVIVDWAYKSVQAR
jgi:hypothetical protein